KAASNPQFREVSSTALGLCLKPRSPHSSMLCFCTVSEPVTPSYTSPVTIKRLQAVLKRQNLSHSDYPTGAVQNEQAKAMFQECNNEYIKPRSEQRRKAH
ncbi:TPA: hypothetical protein ACPZ0W_004793, partial [Enterobacter bugandensis]